MEKQLESPVPELHFDGFKMAVEAEAVSVNLTLNGKAVAVLHTSFDVTKAFGQTFEKAASAPRNFPGAETALQAPRPENFFASDYEDIDDERMGLNRAMGSVDQAPRQ